MIDSYICVDLETTGLNPKTDKIIEIGAVKIRNGKETDRFESYVNPARKLEERIVSLTGIRDENLTDAPYIDEIIPGFLKFADEDIFLGHSILFDFSFLKKAAVNQGLKLEKQGIDTLKIARKFLPELESRSLGYLCEYYKIPHKAHRALEDAVATESLYRRLCEDFYRPETEKEFAPGPLIFQVKKEVPATKVQRERLDRLMKRHGILPDSEIDRMTKNEMSRYTDQILSKYGR